MSLMTDQGEMKEDVKLPADDWLKDEVARAKEILEAGAKDCMVTIVSAMGQEKFISVREGNAI
jgi:hypothetical protein